MDEIKLSLANWGEKLVEVHLPRWHELPDIELYMEQVIKLVEKYLSPIIPKEKHTLLTASMVNNYVKQGLIPPPKKKKYNQKHLAFLIAITLLKQVLSIAEIKQGILFQGVTTGIREAYNLFCDEQESSISVVIAQTSDSLSPIPAFDQKISFEFLAVRAATMSFATKLVTEKVVELEKKYLEYHGDVTYE